MEEIEIETEIWEDGEEGEQIFAFCCLNQIF